MKRVIAILISTVMVLGLAACGNKTEPVTREEMNDPDVRPAISGSVGNMEQYEIAFIGYPIWRAYHNLIQCTQA